MAYPGFALVAMVGVGLGVALWWFFSDSSNERRHSSGSYDRHSNARNDGETLNGAKRRRPRSNSGPKEECLICFEPMGNLLEILRCGHVFHRSCIRKWSEIQSTDSRHMGTCPLCRQSI